MKSSSPACLPELRSRLLASLLLFGDEVAAARNRCRRQLPNPQPAGFFHLASKVFDKIPEGKKTMKLELFFVGMESSLPMIFRIVDELV